MSEIDLLCNGKAPGPYGVAATMIKSWPHATHELVFSCLAVIWQCRTTPHWWLHSYLHPIPKKGAATLDNLRPLGLYEITRKLLAAIPLLITAWDIKRAFDSIPHAFIRLALCRLGKCDDIADWFHYMLLHNTVTVQSPHVQRHCTGSFSATPDAFHDTPHSNVVPSFHQERGIGQVDTPSAIL